MIRFSSHGQVRLSRVVGRQTASTSLLRSPANTSLCPITFMPSCTLYGHGMPCPYRSEWKHSGGPYPDRSRPLFARSNLPSPGKSTAGAVRQTAQSGNATTTSTSYVANPNYDESASTSSTTRHRLLSSDLLLDSCRRRARLAVPEQGWGLRPRLRRRRALC